MSTPDQGGRALLRFRVLGFPVHVDWSFVLFVGLLGWQPGITPERLVIWLVLAFVAVLAHELGHAVAARMIGAQPSIALVALGGVTTYVPPRQLSRLSSLGIALAGPAVGLILGGALVVVGRTFEVEPGSLVEYTLLMAIFTTLGWSVLNLLPIVPLDGGQAMRELLPGDPATRARRASIVSIVLAVALAFVIVANPAWGQFALILVAFFVLVNVLALRSSAPSQASASRQNARQGGMAARGGIDEAVVRLLWEGRPTQARALLEQRPDAGNADLAVHGAVLATTGQREQGMALLHQEWARRPNDPDVTALLALAHLLLGEWRDLARLLTGPSASFVPPALVARAIGAARAQGDEASARDLERAAQLAGVPREQDGDPPLG
jgi:stage IV sporulation protein FB